MCIFITATLPADADLPNLMPIIKRHGLDFGPLDNHTVSAQLKSGETYHWATGASCDCDTGLGGLAFSEETPHRSSRAIQRKVRGFQTRGWSQAKIDRWLAQHDKAEAKRRRAARHEQEDRDLDVQRWIAFLGEALSSGETSSIGLLLHFYSGGPASEQVKIQRRVRHRMTDVSTETLSHLEQDVLYEFTQ